MNTTAQGDEYERACRSIFEKLEAGGEILASYCRRRGRHRVNAPFNFQAKAVYVGGHTSRRIETDFSFEILNERTRERTLVVVECKYHKRSLSVEYLNKFAYDLADIRKAPETARTIGLFFARTGYQEGAKLVAAAERIAIAVFDHTLEEPMAFIKESDDLPWERRDDGFEGALLFGEFELQFQSPAQLLHDIGETLDWH